MLSLSLSLSLSHTQTHRDVRLTEVTWSRPLVSVENSPVQIGPWVSCAEPAASGLPNLWGLVVAWPRLLARLFDDPVDVGLWVAHVEAPALWNDFLVLILPGPGLLLGAVDGPLDVRLGLRAAELAPPSAILRVGAL